MQPERTIRRARRLRKSPTRAEDFFWSLVRDRAVEGLRFRCQVPIGFYVVDFACLSARLIIEADGGVHALRTFDDAKRDAWLTSQGFRVLRFSDSDILTRPNHVLAVVRDAVGKPPSVRLRLTPSPEMGEGRRV
ncbi:MAG: endonuclease domain-containing protein [Brevundimonas sp.]|nr:endonuclease domain-containing protein [Brevundimonas sp.]